MWDKVRKRLYRADVTHDNEDDEWFLKISGLGWKFDSHARGFVFEDGKLVDYSEATVFVDYYPPSGGNIRFDTHVYADAKRDAPHVRHSEGMIEPGETPYWSFCDQLVREYGETLASRGGAGKNRLRYFENQWLPGDTESDHEHGHDSPDRRGLIVILLLAFLVLFLIWERAH
jgi:hypothetical protein